MDEEVPATFVFPNKKGNYGNSVDVIHKCHDFYVENIATIISSCKMLQLTDSLIF